MDPVEIKGRRPAAGKESMKLFECQNCGQPFFFENTVCESCGLALGYLPALETVSALKPGKEGWRALADPRVRYRSCANAEHGVCNWLIPTGVPDRFCAACRHNRTIPDLSQPENLAHWRLVEVAKHRLFYTLIKLTLPLKTKAESPDGLSFDFLADAPAAAPAPVLTGHADGVITINLAEADDAERERRRHHMGEPYRTLLGHFRHEIAHYYWDRLVADAPSLAEFRELFGYERDDYGAALQRYYGLGPPGDWSERFITAYASAHPWEDFAETWAHYFHMIDTLETASAFGLVVDPKLKKGLAARISFDPYDADLHRVIESWLPLTFAINSINRSMGQPDLYPFVLSPPVIGKLAFVHDCIRRHAGLSVSAQDGIRAMIAALRSAAGFPIASTGLSGQ
jgi:hypothetical protein